MNNPTSSFLELRKKDIANTLDLLKKHNRTSDSYCVMPFVNIILEPDGNIGICRHKGHDFTFGNIRDNSIDEIWQSARIQAWREEHLSGKPVICSNEITDRKCNLCPELNKILPLAEFDNTKNPKILRLTANLNGQCNLQCQMCTIWQLPNGFYNENNFWVPARERFFKEIVEVDLLSGEPFIQKDTFRLIDEISSINPNCSWSFTTNLHWRLNKNIINYLDKIKVKYLLISLDSLISETYHKIRYPGNLNFVLENLNELLIYQQSRVDNNLGDLNLRINFLIQKDNWREIKNMVKFSLNKNITPYLSFLYAPQTFSLLDLEYKERVNIIEFYISTLDRTELLFSQRIIKPLLRSLNKIDYACFIQQFQQLTSE